MPKAKKGEKDALLLLGKVAEKVRLQTQGTGEVQIAVFPLPGSSAAYAVEFSKARIVRRVNVDDAAVRRLQIRPFDPALARALRAALLVVVSRTREKDAKA
jgi:hypothetical protein